MPSAPNSTSNFRPLAGRPPFATEEDESVYNRPAQPRPPQQKPDNPNDRTSAYNTYDDYMGNNERNRDSAGAFGVGMGLMGEVSDDSDSEDESPARTVEPSHGKHQALFEAATRSESGHPASRNVPQLSPTSAPNFQTSTGGQPREARQDLRRPPGLSSQSPSKSNFVSQSNGSVTASTQFAQPPPASRSPILYPPAPVSVPVSRNGTNSPMPAPVAQHAFSSPARPMPAFMSASSPAPQSPLLPNSPSGAFVQQQRIPQTMPSSPMELPPSTPITPLFAAAPPSSLSQAKVKFNDEQMPILRGGTEDALLERTPRDFKPVMLFPKGSSSDENTANSVGSGPRLKSKAREGDDFWRRFSVAGHIAEDERKKNRTSMFESSWLRKTQGGTKKFSVWVWVIGLCLLAAIGGCIALIWFVTHGNPSHGRPTAIGGSANESADPSSKSSTTSSAAKPSKGGPKAATATSVAAGPAVAAATGLARARGMPQDSEYVEVFFAQSEPTAHLLPLPTPSAIAAHRRRHHRKQALSQLQ